MESTRFIRKDLKIFRGTAQECSNKQKSGKVENLEIYLAWDTGEIFIGNKQGALVKYGGATSAIERELSKAIDSFKADLNEYTERTASEVINTEVEEKLAAIQEQFTAQTEEAIQNIGSSVDEKIATISASIEDIEALDTAVNNIQTTLQDVYRKNEVYTKSEVDTKVRNSETSTNNAVSIISNKVTALESSSDEHGSSISDLLTEVNNIKNNYATKEYVKSEENHPVRHMTATEMNTIVTNIYDSILPNYTLVFCEAAPAGSNYTAGALYWYDDNSHQFRMLSGGNGGQSSGPTTIIRKTSLSFNLQTISGTTISETEVNSNSINILISGTYMNTSSGGAVSGKITIDHYIDNALEGKAYEVLPDNNSSGAPFVSGEKNLDISTPKVHKYKMYASALVDTSEVSYEIENNNLEKSIVVYQPCLFGSENDFQNEPSNIIHKRSFEGEYEIHTGTKYFLYIPTNLSLNSSVIKQAFVTPYNFVEDGTEQKTWNGVTLTYKKYVFNPRDTDFTITIILS